MRVVRKIVDISYADYHRIKEMAHRYATAMSKAYGVSYRSELRGFMKDFRKDVLSDRYGSNYTIGHFEKISYDATAEADAMMEGK